MIIETNAVANSSSENRHRFILAIRPIELWSFTLPADETKTKMPLLGVEYVQTSEHALAQELPKDSQFLRTSCDGNALENCSVLFRKEIASNLLETTEHSKLFRRKLPSPCTSTRRSYKATRYHGMSRVWKGCDQDLFKV